MPLIIESRDRQGREGLTKHRSWSIITGKPGLAHTRTVSIISLHLCRNRFGIRSALSRSVSLVRRKACSAARDDPPSQRVDSKEWTALTHCQ